MTRDSWRRAAIAFLWAEALGVFAWWAWLAIDPAAVRSFLPSTFPSQVLLAIAVGDLLLYGGFALLAAIGLQRGRRWAFTALCLHTGAAAYAALFGWGMAVTTGEAWLGAIAMTPSLVVLPCFIRALAPERGQ